MKDQDRTKKQLIDDLDTLRMRVDQMERLEDRQGKRGEDLYSNFFDESRDAIIIAGRDGRFVDFNQSALDLLGYTREEMRGMDVSCLSIDPEDRERFIREIQEMGSVTDFDIRLRKK
ncbi:MAG: PAS domain S-box protein, partial [Syntrophobacterales bacterium]